MAKLIMACCAVVVGITLSTFWMQVQTGAVIADMTREIRILKQDQLTDRARIRELAAEQDWVRSSVKIQLEMMK